MAVITLEEYKLLAGISGTTQDARISAYIPLVQSDIVAMCNYDFAEGTADEDFPEGMKLYAAQMITYQMSVSGNVPTKQSESIDGYSYTRADVGSSGYPLSIETGIKGKWGRVSFKIPRPATQFRDSRGMGVGPNEPVYGYPGIPINE